MKVKLLVSRCGPNVSDNAGDIIDVGDAEAKRLIESNQAVPHVESRKETATVKPTEKRKK